ncbi:MAG: 2-oxoacid:ferredoxin oxidoreductase subunit beta [Candidatus Aenigmarchaeota archaeon]|nr:2-oxoacid:ferredoxin oxidoreductase subunit beta [Candidatus Aenigmarchaeota archaeon]
MPSIPELTPKEIPTWCPSCGNFNIVFALKTALAELGIPQEQTVLVSGIGCGSKTPHFLNTYGFEGLHGRGIAVATGIKLVNPNLQVIVTAGDGDTYGIGGNHFIHTARRNLDIKLIIQDNAVYGLTKGQYSPTTQKGFKSPSSPNGSLEEPVNPMALAIIMGATYVARGFSFEMQHLTKLIKGALQHKGCAVIDVLQSCPSYNKVNTLQWYRENIFKLEDHGHNPADKTAALARALELEDGKLPIGLFYHETGKLTYDEQATTHAIVHDDIAHVDIKSLIARAQ